ncbi:MAG: hypothetical protein RLZZ59_419 [Pseudomonadota bacterium]|jgi:molecular chaperone DnaK (HSP70)
MKILLPLFLSLFISQATFAESGNNNSQQNTNNVSEPTRALPQQPAPMKQNVLPPMMKNTPATLPTKEELNSNKSAELKFDEEEDSLSKEKYNKIVEEYKKYLLTVKKEVREEIRAYRKEVARINREKIETYKKLSQEAQNFLAKERDLKKQLPIKHRHKILRESRNSDSE